MNRIKHVLLLLLSLWSVSAVAQVVVEAHLDTANILIGEQVQLRVKCSVGEKQRVDFPYFQPQQELTPGVEVVSNGRVDSVRTNDGKRLELTRRYTITAFDSALYSIPPIEVKVDGKAYASRGTLGLKVSTVAVDTVHVDKFNGPHDVVEAPFEWTWRLAILALVALILLAVTIGLAVRLTDPRLITRRVVIHPPTPPHVTAISHIERIKQGAAADAKAYYMSLTEVLRNYIESRFGFSAREMTSREIIDELSRSQNVEALEELKSILLTADLVKFAKHETSLSEQDRSLVQALDYVQVTKQEPREQPKPRIEYVSLSNRKQILWRNVMHVLAWLLGATSVALTLYLIYELYCCFG